MLKGQIRKLAYYFLGAKILASVGVYIATYLIPLTDIFSAKNFRFDLPYFVWIWANFDGLSYLSIAKYGYTSLQYPFFPLYPVLIATVHNFLMIFRIDTSFLVWGIVISNLCFFAALYVILKLLSLDGYKKLTSLFLLIIITYPTSFFYGAVYNDSLFFLLAALTIYYARKKSFLASSVFGGLATLARLNGLALVFIILLEYLVSERIENQWKLKKLIKETLSKIKLKKIYKSGVYFAALVPVAFVFYLVYVQAASGDYTSLFSAMKTWGQDKITFPPQVFYRYLKILILVKKDTVLYWVAAFEMISVLFYLAMLAYSFKKIRLSYWVFFAVSILIPSLTGTFAGMPRYGLHIYPFFLAISLFLAKKPLRFKVIYFALSLALFLFAITLFTRGYFVS